MDAGMMNDGRMIHGWMDDDEEGKRDRGWLGAWTV